mgnify:CR=1 FL=1
MGKWELLGQLREPRPASGDVPGPWPLRRWGARGPSAPGEMSSVETAKQGVGGLRTEPWDPAGLRALQHSLIQVMGLDFIPLPQSWQS